MRCVFTAICTLAEEIHCNVGHDAGIIASAMFLFLPRCGELRFPSPVLCPCPCLGHIEKGGNGEGVFAFACQGIASLRGRTGNRTVTQMHVRHLLLVERRPNFARQEESKGSQSDKKGQSSSGNGKTRDLFSDPMQSLAPQSIEKIDASRNALPDVTRDVTTVTYKEYSNKLFAMQKTVPHQSGYLLKITAIGSDFRWCLAQELLFTGAIIGMPLRKQILCLLVGQVCLVFQGEVVETVISTGVLQRSV